MKTIAYVSGILALVAYAGAAVTCTRTTKTVTIGHCPNSCAPPRQTVTTTFHPTLTLFPPCTTTTHPITFKERALTSTTIAPCGTTTTYATVTYPCKSCTYSPLPPLTSTVTGGTVTTVKPCPTPPPTTTTTKATTTKITTTTCYACSRSAGGSVSTFTAWPTATAPPYQCVAC